MTCEHFKFWFILKEMAELAGPYGTMLQKPWDPGPGAKPGLCREIQPSFSTAGNCAPMQTIKTFKNIAMELTV